MIRRLLRPVLLALLRRDPSEVDRQMTRFRIAAQAERGRVSSLGRAFLGGYNAMLESGEPVEVVLAAGQVDPHYRPFFYEGAAMGYLPRGYLASGFGPERVESALLAMEPAYRYLYYVGLGFWFGFRHRRHPQRLQALAPHIDPLYFPLCYDGFGFKLGFFDFPGDPRSTRRLERCPEEHRPFIYQGFGRSMFFVKMDDEPGFLRLLDELPQQRRDDLIFGRSLACGFTGVDRPESLLRYVASAPDRAILAARLTGVTWALTARRMNDPDYFDRCIDSAEEPGRSLLRCLPDLCERALDGAGSYLDWQSRTREAVTVRYETHRQTVAG